MTAETVNETEVTKRYPVIKGNLGAYYVIVRTERGYAWRWREEGEPDDYVEGEWWPTIHEALYAAAINWRECGTANYGLAARLNSAGSAYARQAVQP